MRIYLGHSRSFDYEADLYNPIKQNLELSKLGIILPHDGETSYNSPDFYKNLDLFIAAVSYPATGLGVELGWAYDAKVPIVCISRSDAKVSGSLSVLTNEFYRYNNSSELVELVKEIIAKH